jgi:hypothetical protein
MLGRRHVYKLSRLILTKLSKTLFETNYKIGQFTSIHYLAQVLTKNNKRYNERSTKKLNELKQRPCK